MELRVENLKKTFKLSKKQQKINRTDLRVKHALKGISFTAYSGEIFGLLGPNGAGKTTAMRSISTLIKPDTGTITLGDFDALSESKRMRQSIAFLTNELKLEDYFSPNYLFAYFSKLYGVDEPTMKSRRDTLFKRFGIDRFAEVKVADLSSGMKQKTSIAMSLVHDPDVIIFDEPTNGLDVLTAKTVLEKASANPSINMVCRDICMNSTSNKYFPAISTPDMKMVVAIIWTVALAQISALRRPLTSSFRPIENKRRVIPMSATRLRPSGGNKPAMLYTNPATRNPTMGGRPIRVSKRPKLNAKLIRITSIYISL